MGVTLRAARIALWACQRTMGFRSQPARQVARWATYRDCGARLTSKMVGSAKIFRTLTPPIDTKKSV
jgi:hypothetical protein